MKLIVIEFEPVTEKLTVPVRGAKPNPADGFAPTFGIVANEFSLTIIVSSGAPMKICLAPFVEVKKSRAMDTVELPVIAVTAPPSQLIDWVLPFEIELLTLRKLSTTTSLIDVIELAKVVAVRPPLLLLLLELPEQAASPTHNPDKINMEFNFKELRPPDICFLLSVLSTKFYASNIQRDFTMNP